MSLFLQILSPLLGSLKEILSKIALPIFFMSFGKNREKLKETLKEKELLNARINKTKESAKLRNKLNNIDDDTLNDGLL